MSATGAQASLFLPMKPIKIELLGGGGKRGLNLFCFFKRRFCKFDSSYLKKNITFANVHRFHIIMCNVELQKIFIINYPRQL